MTTKTATTLFVHATNVHSGGGQSLLRALLEALPAGRDTTALLDSRMPVPKTHLPHLKVITVAPTVWRRFWAEWWLSKSVGAADLVLCFGNLPPLFRLKGRTVVFVQNRYLVDPVTLASFPLRTRLRLLIERAWFAHKAQNAQAFVVQTPSMRDLLNASGLAKGKPVSVLPFVSTSAGYERNSTPKACDSACGFIYVASGEPHKNHKRLMEAWILLADDGMHPWLWLTVDANAHPELCAWIDEKKARYGLNVENLGARPHDEILRLYAQAKVLVYPSLFESFGLPLIEARQAGLAILASELDYVRDVVDPEQVFDPHSPVSIARAVKRFLGQSEQPLPLMNAGEFLAHVFPEE